MNESFIKLTSKQQVFCDLVNRPEKRDIGLIGARQCGKSEIVAYKTIEYVYTHNVIPPLVLLVAPTYKMSLVLERKFLKYWGSIATRIAGENAYLLPSHAKSNGYPVRVEIRSADNVDSLRGITAGIIGVDELRLIKSEVYEVLKPCLAASGGKFLFATTPHGFDWIYKKFWQPFSRGEDKSIGIVRMRIEDNKENLDPEFIKHLRRSMSAQMAKQELDAEFVNFEGLVYDRFIHKSWKEGGHLCQTKDIPALTGKSVRVIGGYDYGYDDPTSFHIYVISKTNGNIVIADELYANRMLVDEQAMLMRKLLYFKDRERIYRGKDRPDIAQEFYKRHGIVMIPANTRIDAGIDYIRRLIERRKLFVNEDKCRHLLHELGIYQYRDNSKGYNTRDKPVDKENHACLIGNTMITTDKGDIPIESVKVGMKVLTRYGYHKIIDAGMTSDNAEIYVAEFSDGSKLEGTGNHPIWANGGWKRLDTLRYGDNISICIQNKYSWEKSINFIKEKDISAGEISDYIELSGNIIMGKFLKDFISIIKTGIQQITESKISNWLAGSNIYQTIVKYLQSRNENILTKSDHWQVNGINQKQDENGIVNMPRMSLLNCVKNYIQYYVNIVIKFLQQMDMLNLRLNFVPINVNQHGEGMLDWTMLSGSAKYATTNSQRINILKPSPVPSPAVVKCIGITKKLERKPVYNLTVETAHEYYANGILSHNCDDMRYALYTDYIYRGEKIEAPTPPSKITVPPVQEWTADMWKEYIKGFQKANKLRSPRQGKLPSYAYN